MVLPIFVVLGLAAGVSVPVVGFYAVMGALSEGLGQPWSAELRDNVMNGTACTCDKDWKRRGGTCMHCRYDSD